MNSKLTEAALVHTLDMVENDFFSHTGSDGSSAGDRGAGAENIAGGMLDACGAFNAWMGSKGHRANMLSPGSKNMGYAQVGVWFTQTFSGGDCD